MAQRPLTEIKGIGPRRAEALGRLGLVCIKDIAYYAPRSYIDYTHAVSAAELSPGEYAAVRVRVTGQAKQVRIRSGFTMTTAPAEDEAGAKLNLVWFNQPYRARGITAGMEKIACGRADTKRGARLLNPVFYDELPGILPVYGVTRGVSQSVVREAALCALKCVGAEETLPSCILEKYALMPLDGALRALHSPRDFEELEHAKRRLAFEDALVFSLMLLLLRRERLSTPGQAFDMNGALEEYKKRLSFAPTGAQLRAMGEIAQDMQRPVQMNRLLQGDVGSGKTAVAMFAMYACLKNGKTAALMAPTEILARQHYKTLKAMFGENAVLLCGGMKKSERDAALAKLAAGACAVAGTHALLTGNVELPRLGLVIADEQHRFGVRQRAAIAAKGSAPDTLIMSATPIPRTLSLLLYGDLELSVLDELPPGRKPIVTRIVPDDRREDMYRFIEREIKRGRQAYVVCPLVEESDGLDDVRSAREVFDELSGKLDARVELIHGRLSGKETVAERFRKGGIDILVSTTVVEVGVDVPNATVMAIENAGRFGLAQLHQLRGRVGRGAEESYCFLLGGAQTDIARERLSALVKTCDGFKIAQKDLELRGPGEFLGTRQHGEDAYLNLTRLASGMGALNEARDAAQALLEAGTQDAAALTARAMELLAKGRESIARN